MFIFERARTQVGEEQKEKETKSKADSRLWAVSIEPDVGPEPMSREIMTWAKLRSLTDWATLVPLNRHILNDNYYFTKWFVFLN